MEKIYRPMTPEEQLEYISETLEAIKKDGLLGAKTLVEKWELKLSSNVPEAISIERKVEPLRLHDETINEKIESFHSGPYVEKFDTSPVDLNAPKPASIYAAEHLLKVQEDAMGQNMMPQDSQALQGHKTRVLSQEASGAPNIWGDAKTVEPGEIQNIFGR